MGSEKLLKVPEVTYLVSAGSRFWTHLAWLRLSFNPGLEKEVSRGMLRFDEAAVENVGRDYQIPMGVGREESVT